MDVQRLIATRRRLRQQLAAVPNPGGKGAAHRAYVAQTQPLREQIAALDQQIGTRPAMWKPRPATAADAVIARKFKNTQTAAMPFAQ